MPTKGWPIPNPNRSMSDLTLIKLKDYERGARREFIISVAQKLFSEKDFRSVTAREIARAGGMSPGTIYRYYKNLDDLFVDIFLNHAKEIQSLMELEIQELNGCSATRFCEVYITYLNENMTFYQMMGYFMLSGDLSPDTSEKIDPIMRELMDHLEIILKNSNNTTDSRFASHALFSALNGTMISYSRYPGRSLDEIKQHTLRLACLIGSRFEASP